MQGRGHDTIEHTADMGIRGWGPNIEQALEEAALAMLELTIDGAGLDPEIETEFGVAGPSLEELLVEILNALLLYSDINELAFLSVHIDPISEIKKGFSVKGKAIGVPRKDVRDRLLVEVKAATYYGASVAKREDGLWEARCVVDL